ncbi:MAG: rod shape-determining protein RodA [Clostridia bacterium]|nr:rod shape-determining protein RodA [Clostridia bacterium]
MRKIFSLFYHIFEKADLFLLALCVSSSVYGITLILSATSGFGTKKYVIVQLAAMLMGLAAAGIILLVDIENLVTLNKWIYAACVFMLVLTLLIGTEVYGNKNWIILGPVSVQPSEFVKVGFIVTFASHINKVRDNINYPRAIIPLGIHFAVIFGLVMLEGDMGTGLVFLFIFITMLFAAGLHRLYFIIGGVVVAAAAPLVFNNLSGYQQMRILAVYDPTLDPLGYGYHTIQSKIALGSGGLGGAGLFGGVQTQYGILPAKQTDFIFSVAGEELGFIGSMAVLIMISVIILRVFYLAKKARNFTGMLVCSGVGAVFLFQAAENIGMCLGLLPVIGITLPFFSYGGSSMLSSMCLVGLAMSVESHRKGGFFKK